MPPCPTEARTAADLQCSEDLAKTRRDLSKKYVEKPPAIYCCSRTSEVMINFARRDPSHKPPIPLPFTFDLHPPVLVEFFLSSDLLFGPIVYFVMHNDVM
jgi:hypothetical protein